jgi:putative tricarboxylic transport membrane protein
MRVWFFFYPRGVVMKKYDRISSLFWIILAFFICFESIRIDTGVLSNPGPGLFPLVCGIVIGIFGIIVFTRTYLSSKVQNKIVLWDFDTKWREMILTTVSLVVYAMFLNYIGFHVMTLLWMFFICRWVGGIGLKTSIIVAVLTVTLNYLIMAHYLGIQLPNGELWGVLATYI